MSFVGPSEDKVRDLQSDKAFTDIIQTLGSGLLYCDERQAHLVNITQHFLREHATTKFVPMAEAKPKYMRDTLHYVRTGQSSYYSLPWVVGYLLSNYCDLRNSFIKWICDKLSAELAAVKNAGDTQTPVNQSPVQSSVTYGTHAPLPANHIILAEGSVNSIPDNSQFQNTQSEQYLSYAQLLQYCHWAHAYIQQLQEQQQATTAIQSTSTTNKSNTTSVTLDKDALDKIIRENPLAIDLCSRGSIRYNCALCKCGVMIPASNQRPGNRTSLQFDQQTSKVQKKLVQLVFTIMDKLIASVTWDPASPQTSSKVQLLAHYFNKNLDLFKAIIAHVMGKSQFKTIALKQFVTKVLDSYMPNLASENTLYFLDWYLISLSKFAALRQYFNFVNVLKHHNTINNARAKINTRVKAEFQFVQSHPVGQQSDASCTIPAIADRQSNASSQNSAPSANTPKRKTRSKSKKKQRSTTATNVGYSVDPSAVIQALLQIEENECKDLSHLKNTLIFKSSVDGSKGVVVFTITLLNCKVFGIQSRDSCTIISMYTGDEGEKEFQTHFGSVMPKLTKVCKHGLDHKNQHFNCIMYVVNDWKAFKFFTNMFENGMFCGHCDCLLKNRHHSYAPDPVTGEYQTYNVRVIEFKNGLEGAIARYCILHCKCRTHENIMTNILMTRNDPKIYDLLAERFNKYTTLKGFQWRHERGDEDDDNLDQTIKRFPFSRGIQITQLMMNIEHSMLDIADAVELLLLQLNRYIHLVYLEADSEMLKVRDKQFLKDCCKAFGLLFAYKFPNIKGSYYFHYIIRHVPEEADEDIIWSQLQNQGAEAFHSTDPQIKENASSKGGGWKKVDANLQRFLLLLRRVYISSKYKLKWLGKQSDYNKRVYARSFLEASLDAEYADDETYEHGEPLSDDENWDRHCEPENVLFLVDADDEGYDADSDDKCDSDESETGNDSSDDESDDGEYVPNDRHSDDEPLEQQCVPEPDNTVSDAGINFKISEELIQNWHTDLKDHVSAIVSGGMEYVRSAFSHVIPYGVKPDYQPLLSNTVETADGSRERVESDSSAVNADGEEDDVDSNPSKRPRYEPSSTEANGGNDGDIDDEDASQSRRGTKRPRERNLLGETASSTPSASVKKAKHIKHHIFKGMQLVLKQ